jgi:hypothetical protein
MKTAVAEQPSDDTPLWELAAVTTLERALLDLAEAKDGRPFTAALKQAHARGQARPAPDQRDNRAQPKLVAAGYRVLRFTSRRITDDPRGVAEDLRRVLMS